MSLRIALLFLAASVLPVAAVQAPAPAATQQAAPAPTTKMTRKEKKAAAAAAAKASAAPAAAPAQTAAPAAPKMTRKEKKTTAAAPKAAAAVSNELVGNSGSKICHRADCRDASKISAAHRVSFASAADAQAKGYRACKICKPF
jgi:prophage DNA circulation protein